MTEEQIHSYDMVWNEELFFEVDYVSTEDVCVLLNPVWF